MEKARQKIDRNKAALCTRFISLTEGNTFIKCMNLQGSKFATKEEVEDGFFQAVHLSAANGDYEKGSILDTVGELIHKGPAGKPGQGLDCGEGGKCMVKLFFMVRHKEVKDKHDGRLYFVDPGERKGVCLLQVFFLYHFRDSIDVDDIITLFSFKKKKKNLHLFIFSSLNFI